MDKTEYNSLKKIVDKITGCNEKADDLLHDIIIQLSTNQKYAQLEGQQKKYYFIRAVQNQFYSNNSAFNTKYKKYNFDEIPNTYEAIDIPYEEQPSLDWINETLTNELKDNPDFWYQKGLFDIWIQHNCFIHRVHKQTLIPKYSIIETINEVKKLLRKKWEQYGKD